MERRTGDTPMDFEYDNRHGKIDANSPWLRGGDPSKGGFAGTSSRLTGNAAHPFGASSTLASFGAPAFSKSKSQNAPSTPGHSSVSGYRDNSAMSVAFSDTENPSSPDAGGATDDATPEASPEPTRPIHENVTVFRGSNASPARRTSLNPFNSFTLPASWRGGTSTGSSSRPHRSGSGNSGALMLRKVHAAATKRKRPRFETEVALHEDGWTGSDADDSPVAPRGKYGNRSLSGYKAQPSGSSSHAPPPQSMALVPAFFTYLHSHPDLPRILSSYAQTILTYFLMALLVFLVWSAWSVVRSDVDLAVQEAAGELVREVGRCAEEFRRNGCGNANGPPPALTLACKEWNDCMGMDPLAVGRARVGARTFSRILNGFFEGMSWKFLAFVCVLLLVVVGNGRALVPPFVSGARAQPHSQTQPMPFGGAFGPAIGGGVVESKRWNGDTEFNEPFFAPHVPRIAGRSPTRRNVSPSRGDRRRVEHGIWMDEEPGEGMVLDSPTRSPRKLGYI